MSTIQNSQTMTNRIDGRILCWNRNSPDDLVKKFSIEEYEHMIDRMNSGELSLGIDSDFWDDPIDDREKWYILSHYIRRVLYDLMENSGSYNEIQAWYKINMAFNGCYYR